MLNFPYFYCLERFSKPQVKQLVQVRNHLFLQGVQLLDPRRQTNHKRLFRHHFLRLILTNQPSGYLVIFSKLMLTGHTSAD